MIRLPMRLCAGTNFLIRSKAFAECGWSPEYTLTEDYALGMELKMRDWQCRYVPEYLAVGEAPEQVRNCFQQRSRWCKVRPPCPSHSIQSGDMLLHLWWASLRWLRSAGHFFAVESLHSTPAKFTL